MMSFKSFLKEAASIENFLSKVTSAQTEEGLKELEGYYSKRMKEVEVGESDDITVRDAISGRREAIKAEKEAAEAAKKVDEEVEEL